MSFKAGSPQQTGLLFSAGMLLRVIVPPITGIVADARNDRRSMLISLIGLQFLGYLALIWVMTPRVPNEPVRSRGKS